MAGRTAIGLDIGTSVVRAAELSFGRGGVSLEKFGQLVLPEGAVRDGEISDEAAVAEAIEELWSAVRFSHKRVVMGVANQRVVVRKVELPWMPEQELRASLPFQVQDYVPIAMDQSVLDFFPLEEFAAEEGGARMLRGLLVAAAHESVMSSVRCVERAGLSPIAVDLTSFAVLRSMGRQTGLDVQTEALIDIGARVTNVIVHSAGVPRFVRILLRGGQDVTDAVAEKLGVPLDRAEGMKQQFAEAGTGEELAKVSQAVATTAQDFVDEIRGSLDYYASSNPTAPVERMVISGGGSRLVGLVERLSAATRIPVLQGDPLAALRIGNTMLDEHQLLFIKPLAVVPVGLALGGDLMTVEAQPELEVPALTQTAWAPVVRVNLLPREIFEARRFRKVQRLLAGAVALAVVLAGVALWLAQGGVHRAESDLAAAQAQVNQLTTEKAKYNAVPQVLAQVQNAEKVRATVMTNDILWYRYLDEIAAAAPSGVTFTSIAVQVANPTSSGPAGTNTNPLQVAGVGNLTISGIAPSYGAVSTWLNSLNGIPGISSTALSTASKASASSGLTFTCSAVVTSDALSHRYDETDK